MKRYLKLTQESALNTPAATSIYLRLPDPGAFRVMSTPEYWRIMSGTGFAVPALTGTQTMAVAATLTTPLFQEQAQFILGWALTRINTGQTSPWTTTELAGDLASCTAEFAWTNFDGTFRKKTWGGCKVARLRLTGSKGSPVMMLSLDLIGSTPSSSTVSEPAETSFPVNPYLFQHLRGGFTVGSSRSNFESISVEVVNALTPYFDESQYANAVRLGGRSTTVQARMRLKASPDDRALWEAGTAQSLTMVWTGYTHTVTLTANAQNFINSVAEDFPIDREVYYDLNIQNYLDATAGTDFTFAYA